MPTPKFQLMMLAGATPGKVFFIEQEETLAGRDLANDIVVSDPEVSRRHARFLMREDSVFVEDLGSTNGTFLNGERISSPKQLRLGDAITFGENITLAFEKVPEDVDATLITPDIEKTPPPFRLEEEPLQEPSKPRAEPFMYEQPQPAPQRPVSVPTSEFPVEEIRQRRRRGMPAWLIILLIAIVVVLCVIAVTMYFMPASWWCAIDIFGLLEGCPIQ